MVRRLFTGVYPVADAEKGSEPAFCPWKYKDKEQEVCQIISWR